MAIQNSESPVLRPAIPFGSYGNFKGLTGISMMGVGW